MSLRSEQIEPGDRAREHPVGWYFASFGEDLKRGRVRPVQFMSRNLALFRTRSGAVGMIDARCCHMGADLGRCGKVEGERLVCGYHGWAFGVTGRCEHMPLVERIPRRAVQESVPVVERGGNVWFWHGPLPPRPFPDVDYFLSRDYVTLKGEIHVGISDPLPIIEHIADIYHFGHNHQNTAEMQYVVLADDGPVFEYQLRPVHGGDAGARIQGFHPFAFIEFAGPCTGIYRTQRSAAIDRTTPFLTMLLGVTPVREGETIFTWRVAVRKPLPDLPLWPANRAFARLIWWIIRTNVHRDLEVLKWMRPPEQCLLVKPDGPSVLQFRRFYERNLPSRLDGRARGDAPRRAGLPVGSEARAG